jgi:hypothetical protein
MITVLRSSSAANVATANLTSFIVVYVRADWVRLKMYGKGWIVEGNGRYHAPHCACTVHERAQEKRTYP